MHVFRNTSLGEDVEIDISADVPAKTDCAITIGSSGLLYLKDQYAGSHECVNALSLMKALRVAFPDTFRAVCEGSHAAYDLFATEFLFRQHDLTDLTDVLNNAGLPRAES